ncbi:ATP-binding cassette [Lithospermum erythrorhizon]|uniref:ATP-binding cassette n=1 Tax=Lithospermum erythrorhizon TaxID=34254 RepID=A0AAV3RBY7_LITER
MTKENGDHGGKTRVDEASTSKNLSLEMENKDSSGKHESVDKKTNKDKEKTNVVPFYKLFIFADTKDKILMFIGSVAAIGNGLSLPLMTVLFGELIDSFGETQSGDVVEKVSKVSLKFVYLAIGSGVASFFQVSCWMITGERQSARIRGLYLKTILRQDVSFFDMETNTGEVIGRMSGDTVLIQDATGEKVYSCS